MEPTPSANEAAECASACFLIVDETVPSGTSLVTLFQQGALVAASIWTGRSAMDYLLKQRVDLVITDIFMPNGDGLELLRDLFRRKVRPRILAMTGGKDSGMPELLDVAELMSAERTIKKPFEPGHLLKLVREMIGPPTAV